MPTIGTNSRPAYVYDAETDTWIPVGPGEHTHQYIGKDVITTAGDILYASAANTPARLGIGSSGQVLTVASGIPSWATASSGGMTVLASNNLSTNTGTLTLPSISSAYNDLRLIVRDIYPTNNDKSLGIQVNSVTDNDFFYYNGSGEGQVPANATLNVIAGGMANTNDQNYLIVDFYDYANTDSGKCIESVLKYNEAGGTSGRIAKVSGCANTNSAINEIKLIMTDNFGAAGSYVLFGVK